ncbi:PaaI family thioesterase [Jannaschia sp. W003]|uniref:PaaI family thioesterase n=1 Tax=Jannaschia sp. W003 TaxID=2867012 RepID=UPI0021A3546B|nr:PaaI family thioesterase [Jannaschia sp. W003]UWQ20049.1 PaaI family thioesterase [Jannaschia sp. W003]
MFASSPSELWSAERALGVSGLQFMQAILAGDGPHPPIARGMNYRLDAVEVGRVVFRGTPTDAHLNPLGTVHGGWYGTLLDSAMSCAVQTTIPAGRLYTTLEYKVNLVRNLAVGTEVLCEGTVTHAGRTTGVASGSLRGAEDGKVYASGTATCLILAP